MSGNLDSDVKASSFTEGNSPEAVSKSQDLEKISEPVADSSLEACEDTFSEGSIHIVVSEPFSLTENLELYLSDSNSEQGTESFVGDVSKEPIKGQNENPEERPKEEKDLEVCKSKSVEKNLEEINDEICQDISGVSGQTTDTEVNNFDPSEDNISSVKPCPIIVGNLEFEEKSPNNVNHVVDTKKELCINQPKRRGRPPKTKIEENKLKFTAHGSSREIMKPPKETLQDTDPSEPPTNITCDETTKPKEQAISSCNKTISDENDEGDIAMEEGRGLSSGRNRKSYSAPVKVITLKDTTDQSLGNLKSGIFPSTQKVLGEIEKVSSIKNLEVTPIEKSEKEDLLNQGIVYDIYSKNNAPNEIKNTEAPAMKTSGKEALSEQTNIVEIKLNSNNVPNEANKSTTNIPKPTNKSSIPMLTVVSPRELINRTLAVLTNSQPKQKNPKKDKITTNLPKEDENPKSSKLSKEEENIESSNLSKELMIDKSKNEERRKELINLTLAKLAGGKLSKSKQNKSEENIIESNNPEIEAEKNQCEEEEMSQIVPGLTLRSVIPRESKLNSRQFIQVIQDTYYKRKLKTKIKTTSSPEVSLTDKIKEKEKLQKPIPVDEGTLIKNQSAIPENWTCKTKVEIDKPSTKNCSISRTVTARNSILNRRKSIQSKLKTTGEENKRLVSLTHKRKKKLPQHKVKRGKFKMENHTLLPQNEKCSGTNQSNVQNIKFSTVSVATPKLKRGRPPKKTKKNSEGKKVKSSHISEELQLKKMKSEKLPRLIKKIPQREEEVKRSNSAEILQSDQFRNKELMLSPTICLVDCEKFGTYSLNKKVINKNYFGIKAKREVPLNSDKCERNQTDNNVDSRKYFSQLELSPCSKLSILPNTTLNNTLTSTTKKQSKADKDLEITDVIMIDDDDDDKPLISFTAPNLQGSSEKLVLIENPKAKSDSSVTHNDSGLSIDSTTSVRKEHVSDNIVFFSGDNSSKKKYRNIASKKASSPIKKMHDSFSNKVQQNTNVNCAIQVPKTNVAQRQTTPKPHIPNPVPTSHNLQGSSEKLVLIENPKAKSGSSVSHNDSGLSIDSTTSVRKEHVSDNIVSLSGDNSSKKRYNRNIAYKITSLPIKKMHDSFSNQVQQNTNVNCAVQFSKTNVAQGQTTLKPHIQNLVLKNTNAITTETKLKETLPTRVSSQNKQSQSSNPQHSPTVTNSTPESNCSLQKKDVTLSSLVNEIGSSTFTPVPTLTWNNSMPSQFTPQPLNNFVLAPTQLNTGISSQFTPQPVNNFVLTPTQVSAGISSHFTPQPLNNIILAPTQVNTGISSHFTPHSLNNVILAPTQVNTSINLFTPPGKLTQSMSGNNNLRSNCNTLSIDPSYVYQHKHQASIPFSGTMLPKKESHVSSSKKYYFTPLYVLDGEKIVSVNASTSKNAVSNGTPKSHLKTGHSSRNSVAIERSQISDTPQPTKQSHSEIVIDNKATHKEKLKGVQDILSLSASSAKSSSISEFSKNSLHHVPESITVLSTQNDRKTPESPTKRKTRSNEDKNAVSNGTPKSHLKTGHSSRNSVSIERSQISDTPQPTKQSHSEIVIDNKATHKEKLKGVQDILSLSASSAKSSRISEFSKNSLHHVPESITVLSTQNDRKTPESPTKRKTRSNEDKTENESFHHGLVSASSSTQPIKTDQIITSKRIKFQNWDETKNAKPQAKRKFQSSRDEMLNESVDHEVVSTSHPPYQNIECDESNSPKRRRYQELINACVNKSTTPNEISMSKSQNENTQSNHRNEGKQVESKEGNQSTLNTNKSTTQEEKSILVLKNQSKKSQSLEKENNWAKGQEENVSSKKKAQNQNKQSSSLKKENKRVKSKEEELEECLDGIPPFIKEVFKCENIRDGFDNRDLIFVLSLLPDIEEMTSTQRVIFQLKAIQILNDVFKAKKPQAIKIIET